MERIGDAPVEEKYLGVMNTLADVIDNALNDIDAGGVRNTGFVLLVFPFNSHEGRCNYISTAKREDIIVLMKEQIKRFEGQADVTGTA